ncbi:H-2 class II histocompatibility antigen I-E beta chain-like [Crotalus adamanteus]|uniref:H-2 class II histocompatibility antigen I-E beta chain-like n=1 Tax=Crotalus adamanteus TaxID=8729 RepID=A0AAW1BUX2_CROAD
MGPGVPPEGFLLSAPPPPPAHFLLQEKGECHFFNGTRRVRYLFRNFYDRQEISRFDSARGEFEAVTPLGQPDVDKWNSDKAVVQYKKASVDRFCRHNYETAKTGQMVGRRAKPQSPLFTPFRKARSGGGAPFTSGAFGILG